MPNVTAAQPNIGWQTLRKFPNSIPCSTTQSLADVRCWSVVQWRCQYSRTQDFDTKWLLHLAKIRSGARAPKVYILCTSQGEGQTSCKVRLACGERRRCSNEAKTRNPLKFAGVPETHQSIPAVNRPKFAILWGHLEEILLFNNFFPMLCDGAQMAIFCIIFASCISSEPSAVNFRPAF